MDKSLYNKIISANIDVHKKEAEFYDIIHTFGLNWYAQEVLKNDIQKIVRIAPGKKACDLGCGTGNVTMKLLDAGCDVTVVELSKAMLSQLNKKINTRKKINTFCMNIDEFLSATVDKYDIVIINATLHHMPDYLDTISMALNHLSDNGVLYIMDGAHREKINKYYEFIRRCFLGLDKKLYTFFRGNREIIYNHGIDYTYSDYHCNAAGTNGLDVAKIKELIKEKGLKLIDFASYNIGMFVGTLAILDDMLSISKNSFRLLAKKNARID